MAKPNLRPDHNGTQRAQFESNKKKIYATIFHLDHNKVDLLFVDPGHRLIQQLNAVTGEVGTTEPAKEEKLVAYKTYFTIKHAAKAAAEHIYKNLKFSNTASE